VDGVEGYINATASTGLPATEALAWWMELVNSNSWMQIGQFQATLFTFLALHGGGSLTQVHDYWENRSVCGYDGRDLGLPPRANYAYYVTYDATPIPACYVGSTLINMYRVYVRRGSYTNPVTATGWMPMTALHPMLATEKVALPKAYIPGVNPAYYGLNDSHAQNAGYALRPDIHGVWTSWTSTSVPNTQGVSVGTGAPLYHHIGASTDWGQFSTSD
jgi:hypothetical protein